MVDGIDFGSQRVNVFSFSINVDRLELFPSGLFDRQVELVVARSVHVLSKRRIRQLVSHDRQLGKEMDLSHRPPVVETPR